MSDSVTRGAQLTGRLCPWHCPDKNAGVGFHFLLQGIFPTQDQTHISCTGRQFSTADPAVTQDVPPRAEGSHTSVMP